MIRVMIHTADNGEQTVLADATGVVLIRAADSALFGQTTEVNAIHVDGSFIDAILRRCARLPQAEDVPMPGKISPVPVARFQVINGGLTDPPAVARGTP